MQGYVSKEVECPFYKMEQATKLRCEGFSKCCSLQITFSCRDKLIRHKRKYCNEIKGYTECPLYPAIYGQYGEEDYL